MKITTNPWSAALPSVILYEKGKEHSRIPAYSAADDFTARNTFAKVSLSAAFQAAVVHDDQHVMLQFCDVKLGTLLVLAVRSAVPVVIVRCMQYVSISEGHMRYIEPLHVYAAWYC